MARYLVVANQTLGGPELIAEVQRRIDEGDCHLYVVVPATGADVEAGGVAASGSPSSLPAGDPGAPGGIDEARRRAFDRLKIATGRLADLGAAEVDGTVGDPDPMEAVRGAIETAGPFDGIIVSTLPTTISRWLRLDLPSKVRREFGLPVTHVEAAESAPAD